MDRPKTIVFDLDGTLTESKSPIAPDMAELFEKLLDRMPLAVTTGGSFAQLESEFLSRLSAHARLGNLYLLPTSGAVLYEHAGEWKKIYAEILSEEQMSAAERAIDAAVAESGIDLPNAYGPRIERRESQITFSAAGQKAPLEAKRSWDRGHSKRSALAERIRVLLPWAEVHIGGMTSIDVTKKGVNKRMGVERLSRRLAIPLSEMLYVGDALYRGGNDEAVLDSGIPVERVRDPLETAALIRRLLVEQPHEA